MAKGKNVLTTGDVAKICNVAPRTVSKWFDSGQLKGYRIPGSKDRRIPLKELVRFMKAHDMPTTMFPAGSIRVMIVDSNSDTASALANSLENKTNYKIKITKSNFETGLAAQKFSPHIILINLMAEDISATEICKNIRKDDELQTVKIVAFGNNLSDSGINDLMSKGFDGYLPYSADIDEVINKIEENLAIVY
ncbi:MAG: helix-turn-helix domain-containing protein [Planctomycetota bacterium]|jgi:excisionase family DNA binding protein